MKRSRNRGFNIFVAPSFTEGAKIGQQYLPAGRNADATLWSPGILEPIGQRKGVIEMSNQLKVIISRLMILMCLIGVSGCASPPKTLDPSISGPQMIVNPETIRLGVAKVLDTKIFFEGSGFKAKDSIYIELLGPKQAKLVVAEALIQPDGTFKAEVSKLAKITEILRADASFEIDKKYREFVIITQPPIPKGIYTAKVICMSSNLTAETKLTIKGPSMVDRTKDLLGRILGKIRFKKAN